MFNSGSAPSLSDIAAVTNNNRDGFMDGNNGWWILIILFFCPAVHHILNSFGAPGL